MKRSNLKGKSYHRQTLRSDTNESYDMPSSDHSRGAFFWIMTGILFCLVCALVFVMFHGEKKVDVTDSQTKVINGINMTVVPAEKQIEQIKNAHAEIEKCTNDKDNIYCTDVAGEKTQYPRQYVQDMVY